jgi:hypothetical protein
MTRGSLTKVDMLARVYKMKNELYNGTYHNHSGEWHDGAHDMVNKVLEVLKEYSR